MSDSTAEVVICGAGIAGVSAAYQLAVVQGQANVVIVDPLPPLSLTSDKSTESYRNWWPGPGDDMVRLTNRSLDIMEDLHRAAPGRLLMHRRGYIYGTATPAGAEALLAEARANTALGAGDLRVHRSGDSPGYIPVQDHGLFDAPTGADVLLDPALIRKHFPCLADDVLALLHARRCGWFSAHQFGMYMLEQALARGVRLVSGRVSAINSAGGRVRSVAVEGQAGVETLLTGRLVVAAGPLLKTAGKLLGVEFPIVIEPHLKVMFSDHLRVVPRDLGLLIWNDPLKLPWSDEERAALAEDGESCWLLDEFPSGVHGRPEGVGDTVLLQWTLHDTHVDQPVFPIPIDRQLPELVVRGMARVIPGLSVYFNQLPRAFIDGGYYARTAENRPLVGPLPVEGAYVIGGFGGFGMHVSFAAGELLAKHVTGSVLPDYAPAFLPNRYDDPKYQDLLRHWGASGQI